MGFATFFHLIAVAQFYFGFYYDNLYMTEPDAKFRKFEFGGRLIYLTIWNLIFQCIYYTIALLNDIIGSNEASPAKKPLIRKIRDYFFATFAFPFAANVSIMFHVLMVVDRNLVMPKEVDEFFPFWLNHLVHTNILIFIVIEMFILPRSYPCRKAAMTGMTIIQAIYLAWVFCIKANTDKWVYGVLAVLSWPERIGFFAFSFSIPVVLYFVGEFVNKLRWGSVSSEQAYQSKKKKQKTKAN